MSAACLHAIGKDLPAIIFTQLYQTSGEDGAYGISFVLRSLSGVASIMYYSFVINARLPC